MQDFAKRNELVNETIDDLRDVQNRIQKRHKGDLTLSLRIDSVINQLVNSLSVNLNGVSATSTGFKPQPLTNVAGVEINEQVDTKLNLKPIEIDEVEIFREKIQSIYDSYLNRETKDILDSLQEIEIKGVAKLAGIEDYDKVPADEVLINRTKEAIVKQNELKQQQDEAAKKIENAGVKSTSRENSQIQTKTKRKAKIQTQLKTIRSNDVHLSR